MKSIWKIYEEVFEILFNVFVFIYKWLLSFVLEYEYSKSTRTRVRVHEYDYSISAIYIIMDIPVRLIFWGANICVYWII